MSRDIAYEPELICDVCKHEGAYDVMGDYICEDCLETEEKQ